MTAWSGNQKEQNSLVFELNVQIGHEILRAREVGDKDVDRPLYRRIKGPASSVSFNPKSPIHPNFCRVMIEMPATTAAIIRAVGDW